jgi:hypothetical protein
MKITLLNGNPDSTNTGFDGYLKTLTESLESKKYEIVSAADDSIDIRSNVINSDLIIFASPVIMGFTSALLKRVHDKFVPLVLPYTGLYYEESHHHPRYEKYPAMGLVLQPDSDTDEEDIDIIKNIYRRDSLNFHADLVFTALTSDSPEKVINEINSL